MTLRELWRRSLAFVSRDALDREVDDEIAAHVDMAAAEHVARGVEPAEARRRALTALGSRDAAKATHREARGLPSLDGLLQDIRYAIRGLRRSPGFTVAAIITLAIGIGLNTAVFTVLHAVLLDTFPFISRGDRLLYVERPGLGHSYADFEAWRAEHTPFDDVAAAAAWLASVRDDAGPAEIHGISVMSTNTLRLIGQRPALGRDFTPDDARPGAAPVVLLSDRLWAQRYGRDPSVVGRRVHVEISGGAPVLSGHTATIIGIMPPDFSFPFDQELWAPLIPPPTIEWLTKPTITVLVGRLTDGVPIETARAALAAIGRRLAPAGAPSASTQVAVQDFNEHFVGPRATATIAAMYGACTCLVFIACINVANLILARGIHGRRERALRLALGAGRWHLARQTLVESLLLSAAGGLLAVPIASLGVRAYALTSLAPFNYPHYVDMSMDAGILAYLAALIVATALCFGLGPAVILSRGDTHAGLADDGRGATAGPWAHRASSLLVAGEVALAFVLLASAGIMAQSALNIYTTDVGVDTDSLLVSDLGLPLERYPTLDAQAAFATRLVASLTSTPGVTSAAVATRYPTQGTPHMRCEVDEGDGRTVPAEHSVAVMSVGPGYFHAVGARVIAGREFGDSDTRAAEAVALVSERFAERHWPGASPLGRRIRLAEQDTPAEWHTIVGVVADIVQGDSTRQAAEPVAYVPFLQRPTRYMYVFVDGPAASRGVTQALDEAVSTLDPNLPADFMPLAGKLAFNYRAQGLHAAVLLLVAAVGLLLACIGLSSVVAYAVNRRTAEIGLRMALGATARDVLALVATRGIRPVALGLAAGACALPALAPFRSTELAGVTAMEPRILFVAAAALILAALAGCLVPARRAARLDPAAVLRALT